MMNTYKLVACAIVFVAVVAFIIKPLRFRLPSFLKNRYAWIGTHVTFGLGLAPLVGSLILLAAQAIKWQDAVNGIVGSEHMKPYTIVIIFFTLAYLCISLDLSGIFDYIAQRAIFAAKGSGVRVYIAFFVLSSAITVLTSNDIVILTLTPIITYFAHHTGSDATPFLLVQYFSCNIWSIFLVIGNPTNIIVAEAFRIPFLVYTSWMALPSACAGLTCVVVTYFYTRKRIPITIQVSEATTIVATYDKIGAVYGIGCLLCCLVMLAIANNIGLSMWMITSAFAFLMLVKDIFNDVRRYRARKRVTAADAAGASVPGAVQLDDVAVDGDVVKLDTTQDMTRETQQISEEAPKSASERSDVLKALKRLPWEVMPFVVGMFILVEGINSSGWVELFARGLRHIVGPPVLAVFVMCFLSTLACNILNNQPMTILFTRIIQDSAFSASPQVSKACMYGLIMGSNFGANFTIIGALAGIMWVQILKDKGISMPYFEFCKHGFIVMPTVVVVACAVLAAELAIFDR